jgi:hypothetical protein
LEANIKLQIIENLKVVLNEKLNKLSDLSEIYQFIFIRKEEIMIKIEESDIKEENMGVESIVIKNETIIEETLNPATSASSALNQNQIKLLKILDLRVEELKNLLHYFKKIEVQSLGKSHSNILSQEIKKIEWLFEFFKKTREILGNDQMTKVSFSFNELWQFLSNECFGFELLNKKIQNFKNFFSGTPIKLNNFKNLCKFH